MNKTVKIALIGYGTVGKGTVKILQNQVASITQKAGAKIEIAAVCDIRQIELHGVAYTNKYQDILNRADIDIVVELIGGYEPARTIILAALKAGKHIVTANKAVLAKYWDEIFSAAHAYRRLVYFEASVGGAVPVVQALNEGLAANKIEKITGILNGTTNYILSEMARRRVSFKVALNLARSAGFAEADPSFDIEGIDTAHKLSILSSLAWSRWVKLSDITVSGINGISEEDLYFVQKEFDYVIKLIGSARYTSAGMDISVEPRLISKNSAFANVDREYNAVMIKGDSSGDVMLYGKGAGQFPAASAVVSDIIILAREVANGTAGKLPYVTYDKGKSIKLLSEDKKEGSFYLRFTAIDKPGVLSKVAGVLGKYRVSIDNVYQKEPFPGRKGGVPIIMLTHKTSQAALNKALKEIDNLSVISEKTVKYKIEE